MNQPIALTFFKLPGVHRGAEVPNHIVIDTGAKEATFRGFGREIGPLRWADAD